jgi:D-arabinose 1-dehydrogenase-like Zn-dependent alcohol dehydrogenase
MEEISLWDVSVAGSLIGGIKETQEMLDFCGEHNITSDIELIKILIQLMNVLQAMMLNIDL